MMFIWQMFFVEDAILMNHFITFLNCFKICVKIAWAFPIFRSYIALLVAKVLSSQAGVWCLFPNLAAKLVSLAALNMCQ